MEQMIPILILIAAFVIITFFTVKLNKVKEQAVDESYQSSIRRIPNEYINSDFMDTSSRDTRRSHMRNEREYSDSLSTSTVVKEKTGTSSATDYDRRMKQKQVELKKRLEQKTNAMRNTNQQKTTSAKDTLKSAFELLKEEYKKNNQS